MKPANVKSNTQIDFNEENSKEDPEFKVGDHVRISKYKDLFVGLIKMSEYFPKCIPLK